MRKFVRGLICGMMVLTLSVPTGIIPNTAMERTVYATEADTTVLEGRCGDNTKYTYDSGTNTLTISGTGEMWDEIKFPKTVWMLKI